MTPRSLPARQRALTLLGPLEAEIMGAAWSGTLSEPFVVRDVAKLLPRLAYTTVMTTVQRLATKGLLTGVAGSGPHGHRYTVRETPDVFLGRMSRREAQTAIDRFGDAALAAFAAQLDKLSAEQRARLDRLAARELP
jgi:predicted transcriptional regulator